MTFYAGKAALAERLLLKYGFDATVRAVDVASDPVTGGGGTLGADRTVRAAMTGIDYKTFPEALVQAGDQMAIFDGPVRVGEFVAGKGYVKAVRDIQPDDATHIISKALISG